MEVTSVDLHQAEDVVVLDLGKLDSEVAREGPGEPFPAEGRSDRRVGRCQRGKAM